MKVNAPDIIAKIFQDLGFSDFDSSGLNNSYPKRDYCVQYRETDFNFVARLMEEEGIFYSFRHDNGKHVLVLGDRPTAYRDAPDPVTKYQHAENAHSGGERITQWEHRYEYRTGKWAHTDYNFESPRLNLMADENSVVKLSNNAAYEVYDYPGIYDQKGKGGRLVRVRMEEVEAGYDLVVGESLCRVVSPGEKFTLQDYEVPSENGQAFVLTSVEHDAYEPADYETVSELERTGSVINGPHLLERGHAVRQRQHGVDRRGIQEAGIGLWP